MKNAKRIIVMAVLTALACGIAAQAQQTTRKRLKKSERVEAVSTVTVAYDTIAGTEAETMAQITGYEKPLRASRETFMLRNLSAKRLVEGEFELTYYDMKGNMLHRRTVRTRLDIPAGERRMVSLRPWDVNRMFYYHLNRPQRTSAQATPYAVKIKIISLLQ